MKRILHPWLVLLTLLSQLGTGCKDPDAPGQANVFLKIYGTEGNDVSTALVQLEDGGFLITGSVPDLLDSTASTAGDNDGIAFIRTDALGRADTLITMGGYGNDRGEDMLLMTNGDVLITGHWADGPNGGTDMFVMRLTVEGEVVWTQYLNGSGNDYGYALAATEGGEYYAVGVTESTEFGAAIGNDNLVVWKFDADGNSIWAPRGYGGSLEDQARSAVATSDGGLAIAGFSKDNITDYDAIVLKLTASGDTAWVYRDSLANAGFGAAVQETDAGELLLLGHQYSSAKSYDILYRNLSASGVVNSAANVDFGGEDNDRYQCKRFLMEDDGSLVGAGWSQSFGEGANDFLLFILKDNKGEKLRTYGGSNDDVPTDMIFTRDGGIALLGHTKSFSANTDKDIILILTDANGNLVTED